MDRMDIKIEYDDQGVLCAEHPKLGCLTCEDSCRCCDRPIDKCGCDEPDLYEADTSNEEIDDLYKEVYQVRDGDGELVGGDKWCIDECFSAITDYYYEYGEFTTLTITITPKLDEERCEYFGLPYEVRVIYTITGQ